MKIVAIFLLILTTLTGCVATSNMLGKEERYVKELLDDWQGELLEDFLIANPHIDRVVEGVAFPREVGNSRFKFKYTPKEANPEYKLFYFRLRSYGINLLTDQNGRIDKTGYTKVEYEAVDTSLATGITLVVVIGIGAILQALAESGDL